MKTIPEVRARLHALADELGVEELHALAEATRRRPASRRTAAKSTPMTASIAEGIRRFAEAKPQRSHVEIANAFGVNPGRVSEALSGRRAYQ